jgi:hypothetical protein
VLEAARESPFKKSTEGTEAAPHTRDTRDVEPGIKETAYRRGIQLMASLRLIASRQSASNREPEESTPSR